MTKAALLRLLERVPMNAEIMFVDAGLEFELRSAFTVTGPRGLVVLLTEGETPSGYDDIEGLR